MIPSSLNVNVKVLKSRRFYPKCWIFWSKSEDVGSNIKHFVIHLQHFGQKIKHFDQNIGHFGQILAFLVNIWNILFKMHHRLVEISKIWVLIFNIISTNFWQNLVHYKFEFRSKCRTFGSKSHTLENIRSNAVRFDQKLRDMCKTQVLWNWYSLVYSYLQYTSFNYLNSTG